MTARVLLALIISRGKGREKVAENAKPVSIPNTILKN
jgi:hypothetical protein